MSVIDENQKNEFFHSMAFDGVPSNIVDTFLWELESKLVKQYFEAYVYVFLYTKGYMLTVCCDDNKVVLKGVNMTEPPIAIANYSVVHSF